MDSYEIVDLVDGALKEFFKTDGIWALEKISKDDSTAEVSLTIKNANGKRKTFLIDVREV